MWCNAVRTVDQAMCYDGGSSVTVKSKVVDKLKLQVKHEREGRCATCVIKQSSVAAECTGLPVISSALATSQLRWSCFESFVHGLVQCCVFTAVSAMCAR